MAMEPGELRRVRGQAKGHITRAKASLTLMKGAEVRTIVLDKVQRMGEGIEKADAAFHEAQYNLRCADREDAQEPVLAREDEEHGHAMIAVEDLLETVQARGQTYQLGKALMIKMEALKEALAEGYLPAFAEQFMECTRKVDSFRAWSVRGSSMEVEELKVLSEHTTQLWNLLCKIRAGSGYSSDPLLGGAASPPAHSLSLNKLKVKMPTFDGMPEHWEDFKNLFWDILKADRSLTSEAAKKAILMDAVVDSTAKARLSAMSKGDITLEAVMAKFGLTYEDPREMISLHLNRMLQIQTVMPTKPDIDRLIDVIEEGISGLTAAKSMTAEQVFTAYFDGKMSPELRRDWRAKSGDCTNPPTLTKLLAFLRVHRGVVAGATVSAVQSDSHRERKREKFKPATPPNSGPEKSKIVFRASQDKLCGACGGTHIIYACPEFKAHTPARRQEIVKEKRLCFNCLIAGHRVGACKSNKTCLECKKHHHTLLHEKKARDRSGADDDEDRVVQRVTSIGREASLSTTAVVTMSSGACVRTGRVLIDMGSEVQLISQAFARSLNARPIPNSAQSFRGIGMARSEYAVQITLHGEDCVDKADSRINIVAHVMKDIIQPSSNRAIKEFSHVKCLKGLPLADPEFGPGATVDLVLGNDVWYSCRTGKVVGNPELSVFADQTIFGWVLGGPRLKRSRDGQYPPRVYVVRPLDPDEDDEPLSALLERLCQAESDLGEDHVLSPDEIRAEEHFVATHKREDGRFVVEMPMIEDPPALGESLSRAVQRFHSVKKSLIKRGLWTDYRKAVQHFLDAGHAEVVPEKELDNPQEQVYYMPMHAVIKESSASTRVRPVCDASAATSTGKSYNDILLTGPSLYHSLVSIVLRFREPAVAMTADVSKMYRQLMLALKDRNFHRFLFDVVEGGPLVHLRMTRVTFGVRSSPFVAARALRQLSIDEGEAHPEACRVIAEQFYMDDVLTGAKTVENAKKLRQELNDVLGSARLPLCKWRSNSSELLESVPTDLQESTDLTLMATSADHHKALGLHWVTTEDALYVATPVIKVKESVTKRQLTSAVARVFDPLGWFAPTLIVPRMLVQESWKARLKWDTDVPDAIFKPWKQWAVEMQSITTHPIPRAFEKMGQPVVDRELHGFSDASDTGYGGVVMLRCTLENGDVQIYNVLAKGRVAPTTPVTTPRLELCGALVVAKLMEQVAHELKIPEALRFVWTDSTVVLGWLSGSVSRLNQYVANRVVKIVACVAADRWGHVAGRDNPADCLSRGIGVQDLLSLQLWWQGPPWLKLDQDCWPKNPNLSWEDLPEIKKVVRVAQEEHEFGGEQTHFNKWIRVVAYMRRFISNAGKPRKKRTTFLSSAELLKARERVLYSTQLHHYADIFKTLAQGKTLYKRHFMAPMCPYVDEVGLLRADTRLNETDLPELSTCPIILCARSPVVKAMLKEVHDRMKHVGTSATMASITQSFHIFRLKQTLDSIRKRCMECQKRWAKPVQQCMGRLPSVRTKASKVFESVGVDYAGPVTVKTNKGRSYKSVKTYLALFICMTTRAVHLEVVADASTPTFLAALDRFCGRRGKPAHMYSDNGRNFVGADRQLRRVTADLRQRETREQVHDWSGKNGIRWHDVENLQWHFQPPRAPGFGGLWEAGVKSMKNLLRSSARDVNFNYDEMTTMTVSAEAILNSRPYIPVQSTATDGLCPLTPGHFLVGHPLTALPQQVDCRSKLSRLHRWNLVKRLEYQLWMRWRRLYLSKLRGRAKEQKPHPNLRVGDVVLLTMDNVQRNQWPMGKVVKLFPGPDERVRVVDVRVVGRVYRRSVRHLVALPMTVEESSDEPGSGDPGGGVC